LISGAAWGRLELPPDAEIEHPALRGSTFRACPTCIGRHPDWQDQLLTSLGIASGFGLQVGLFVHVRRLVAKAAAGRSTW